MQHPRVNLLIVSLLNSTLTYILKEIALIVNSSKEFPISFGVIIKQYSRRKKKIMLDLDLNFEEF